MLTQSRCPSTTGQGRGWSASFHLPPPLLDLHSALSLPSLATPSFRLSTFTGKYWHHHKYLSISVDNTFSILILKSLTLVFTNLCSSSCLSHWSPWSYSKSCYLEGLHSMIKPHCPNTAILVTLLLSHHLLCLLILLSSCQHQLLSSGRENSIALWTGARVSSFSPLTSGFSTPCLKLLSPMSRDFCIAKPEGHFSPYLINPLLYIPYSWHSLLLGLLIHLSPLIFFRLLGCSH